jgi:hypothetical protein
MVRPANYTRDVIIKPPSSCLRRKASRARGCGTSLPKRASQQLRPLLFRDEMSRYIRMFA